MGNVFTAADLRERRRSPRVTPDPFLVIHLPGGNQGVVLDLCEQGLGFLASAPVEDADTLRFEISARWMAGAAAAGQLMWTDGAGKRGGLRFTHLSREVQAIIQACLARPEARARSVRAPQIDAGEMQIQAERTAPLLDNSRAYVRKGAWLAHGIALAVACFVALGIWYTIDQKGALQTLARLKDSISPLLYSRISHVPHGWSAVAPPTSATEARPNAEAEVVPASGPVPGGDQEAPVESAPADAETPPAPLAAAEASLPVAEPLRAEPEKPSAGGAARREPGEAQLLEARKLLQADTDRENLARAVPLLWQAVGKGNAAAEVELAGLYLSGRGVAKNCNQAVVLLNAAENRQRELVEEKLATLSQYGCELEQRDPARHIAQ